MARIADFNVGCARHNPRAQGQCSVVINNHQSASSPFPDRITYPPVPEQVKYNSGSESTFPSVSPGIVTREVKIDTNILESTDEVVHGDSELELYKLIAHTFAIILKDNNPKLIANMIDCSGKIIIDATNLCQIIALMCGVRATDVHIEYEVGNDGGCIAKINPIKKIENIKINFTDFKLGYNKLYNILNDTYHISLKRVLIGGY